MTEKYITRTVDTGLVINRDGTSRKTTSDENAQYKPALDRSFSETKEMTKPDPPPMIVQERGGWAIGPTWRVPMKDMKEFEAASNKDRKKWLSTDG